jgi:Helix-turn-helix domain
VKPEAPPGAQLLTVPQAARALQLPPKSVYALASRGALRGVVRFGRVVRINLAEALRGQPAPPPTTLPDGSRRTPQQRSQR